MENTETNTATTITNHIEMIDAIQFNMNNEEGFELICIYIEKYNILSYYNPHSYNKSITVIDQNDPAYVGNLFKSYSNIKISIKEIERFQHILQLQKELIDVKIGAFSFEIV